MFHWRQKLLFGSPQIGTAIGAAVGIGGSIISSNAQSKAADRAADAQTAAAYAGIDEQSRQFDKVRELLQPWVDAGSGGLDSIKNFLGVNGSAAQLAAINGVKSTPAFTSALQAGENAILQNASATGGLRGGNTKNALGRFAPQLLNSVVQQQIGNLQSLSGQGLSAAGGLGTAGQTSANNISNLLQQVGAAQAGNALAQGNAQQRMFGGISNGIGMLTGALF